jgi:hypothetical protein
MEQIRTDMKRIAMNGVNIMNLDRDPDLVIDNVKKWENVNDSAQERNPLNERKAARDKNNVIGHTIDHLINQEIGSAKENVKDSDNEINTDNVNDHIRMVVKSQVKRFIKRSRENITEDMIGSVTDSVIVIDRVITITLVVTVKEIVQGIVSVLHQWLDKPTKSHKIDKKIIQEPRVVDLIKTTTEVTNLIGRKTNISDQICQKFRQIRERPDVCSWQHN